MAPEQSEAMSNVKREGSKVWVEGVPDMVVGDRWDMLLRGMEILLKHRGEKISLNELMAYSGDAFNLCHASHWQGTAYMCVPTDPCANIAKAYGYSWQWSIPEKEHAHIPNLEQKARGYTEESLRRIRAEIDAGRPVLVGGVTDQGCGPWTVVVGYDETEPKLAHVGLGPGVSWSGIRGVAFPCNAEEGLFDHWNGRVRGTVSTGFLGGWRANPAFVLGDKTSGPSDGERTVAVLKRAVEMFRAPAHRIGHWGGVVYYFGEQAYEQWARALEGLDYPADLKKPQPKGAYDWYEMGNMDTQVDQIVRGRTAAAEFCERAAGVLPEVRAPLEAAAKFYSEEVAIAQSECAPFISASSGADEPRVAWLSDRAKCEAGVAAVRRMLEKERAAIAEIEKALAVEAQP
ncbi:MAG: hypothetical protein WBC53_02695 [Phycisphaerae bacterium]